MGINRFKCVGMGTHGCVGTHDAWATQKQGKKGGFRVSQVSIWALSYGRGIFPGHDVVAFYARMVKDG